MGEMGGDLDEKRSLCEQKGEIWRDFDEMGEIGADLERCKEMQNAKRNKKEIEEESRNKKGNFLSTDRRTDGNISALRAGVPLLGPPEKDSFKRL